MQTTLLLNHLKLKRFFGWRGKQISFEPHESRKVQLRLLHKDFKSKRDSKNKSVSPQRFNIAETFN